VTLTSYAGLELFGQYLRQSGYVAGAQPVRDILEIWLQSSERLSRLKRCTRGAS